MERGLKNAAVKGQFDAEIDPAASKRFENR